MLDQRRALEKGYITLKEAASISNYSPDHIGHLIRAGKIRGRQCYNNVAWVTTRNEIEAYLLEKKGEKPKWYRRFSAPRVVGSIQYALLAISVLFLIAVQYVLYTSIDRYLTNRSVQSAAEAGDVVVIESYQGVLSQIDY